MYKRVVGLNPAMRVGLDFLRPTIRLVYSLFKARRHVIVCINHAIIVGLCSLLLVRLSYYIHLGYGKNISPHMGIEPRSYRLQAVYSTRGPER